MMDRNWKSTFNFLLEYKMKCKHLDDMSFCPDTRVFTKLHTVLIHAFPRWADIVIDIFIEMILMRLKLLTGKEVGETSFLPELMINSGKIYSVKMWRHGHPMSQPSLGLWPIEAHAWQPEHHVCTSVYNSTLLNFLNMRQSPNNIIRHHLEYKRRQEKTSDLHKKIQWWY